MSEGSQRAFYPSTSKSAIWARLKEYDFKEYKPEDQVPFLDRLISYEVSKRTNNDLTLNTEMNDNLNASAVEPVKDRLDAEGPKNNAEPSIPSQEEMNVSTVDHRFNTDSPRNIPRNLDAKPVISSQDISSDSEDEEGSMELFRSCTLGDLKALGEGDVFSQELDGKELDSSDEESEDESTISSTVDTFSTTFENSAHPNSHEMEMRDYQAALYEIAKKQNIIACLPTGSGKTLIAIKLMEFFHESVTQNGKKIVFLANTVPLLKQQARSIEEFTSYNVQLVHGGNKNQWKNWKSVFSSSHVFVMIPAVFMDIMDHGFIKFDDLALLVLDECHHALKANPMSIIMDRYNELSTGAIDLPRVLGLSATILKKNINAASIETAIQEVEKKLSCKAITYEVFQNVLKYSTNAELIIQNYDPNPRTEYADKNFCQVFDKLDQVLGHQMDSLAKNISSSSTEGLMQTLDKLKKDQQIFKELRNSIQDIRQVLSEIGPMGAMVAANIKHDYFSSASSFVLPNHIRFYYLTVLRTFMFRIQSYLKVRTVEDQFKFGCSSKTLKLLSLLSQYRQDPNALCGIVFVQRRMEAHALGAFLEELSLKCADKWGFIKPGIILGTNKVHTESSKYRQSSRQQSEKLNDFHNGLTNLIIATSVIQEGIDVRACGFVVRFDPVESYPSFIQSMGRARRKDSKYYVMLSNDEAVRGATIIENFQSLKTAIDGSLQEQMSLIKDALVTNLEENDEGSVRNMNVSTELVFCPGGKPESPRITAYNAIQTVNKYTSIMMNNVPSTKARHAVCLIRPVDASNGPPDPEYGSFYALVQLPANTAVTQIVTGPIMTGRKNAKRAAFLEVCKKLYTAGVFDENLIPRRPTPS